MTDRKQLLNYTLSSIFAVVLAGGCITPAYYSHQQDISLTIPEGATAEIDGKPLEKNGNTVHTTVNRSWQDKEIIVKKEGYKDEKVILDSVATNEKWANDGHDSGATLLIPVHTMVSAGAAVGAVVASPVTTVAGVATKQPEVILAAPAVGVAGLLSLPFSLGVDLCNIFIGAPSTVIINPWRKYQYSHIVSDMEPIDQNNLQDVEEQQ